MKHFYYRLRSSGFPPRDALISALANGFIIPADGCELTKALFVAFYSCFQGAFHVSTVEEAIQDNFRTLGEGVASDWTLLGVFETYDEARDWTVSLYTAAETWPSILRGNTTPQPVCNISSTEPLAAGLFDLGEGWDLLVEPTGSNVSGSAFSAGLWDGTDQVAYAEDDTPAQAILTLLLVTTETGATFPAEKMADMASRAAREIALSMAAPTTPETPEETSR